MALKARVRIFEWATRLHTPESRHAKRHNEEKRDDPKRHRKMDSHFEASGGEARPKVSRTFRSRRKKKLALIFCSVLTRWPSIRANIAAMCFMCDTSHSALVSNWMMPIKSCQQNGKWRKFHDSSRMLREHWICEIERVDIPRQSIRHADNYDRIAEVEKYVMLNLGFTVIYAHTEKANAKHAIKQCCRSRS